MGYNESVVEVSSKVRHLRYEPLRRQLSEVSDWPHRYRHKIIGLNKEDFKTSVEDFKRQFPSLKQKGSSLSRNGTYLSMTFEFEAENVDEIISLWVASEEISDFVRIL
ncbi:MAG: DUF493 family protein [Bradymonadales bacterium]|nr:MAG: DUF493 family protein [Bradymonadales bacterium]